MYKVSIIISARNEMPQLPLTITNLMLDMDQSGIKDYEFIVADNGSEDQTTRFFTHAWNDHMAKTANYQIAKELKPSARGLIGDGRLRFCHDPVFSNVGARDRAVKYARYENIIFADGHIAVKANTIKNMIATLNLYEGGIIHVPVSWMGSWSGRPRAGIQYSYKVGEKIWGTWNYAQVSNDPFYIPVSGHCFFAVKKSQYCAFGGYDTHQQIYGGGENYLDTLYWLMGSHVMVDPRGLCFHLSAGRGYSYNTTALTHNMILTAYTLGGEKWSERILLTYLNKGLDPDSLMKMYRKTLEEGREKREFILKNQVMSFEELLGIGSVHDCDGSCRGDKYIGNSSHARRKWDILNDKLHGKHLSFVQVFEDWTTRLTNPNAIEFFQNSPNQN